MRSKFVFDRWMWMAPLGLALAGMGLSLTGEATLWKGAARPAWDWVALGTAGLCAFNAGISVFGAAVLRRCRLEMRRPQP
jgi:hypothetical protein